MEFGTTSPPADVLGLTLQLRPELRCAAQFAAGIAYYQIEDPLTNRFHRLGAREWEVARRLDGKRTLRALIEQLALTGGERLAPAEVVALARWLVHSQLARVVGTSAHPAFANDLTRGKLPVWLNPVFIRLPLFNPDRMLTALLPWFRWAVSPGFFTLWCLVVITAIYRLAVDWQRFRTPLATILARENWIYLLLAWAGLKAVHEFFHGLVCKKYGGRVPSCGLMLILFSPVAFVDVTSSWQFRSKWQRIFTASAGMYAELFIAALALHVWCSSESGFEQQLCHNLVTMAGLSTLLFNANFLMKFDGYYIFSDLLELQNLYGSGQQHVRYLVRRYLLGVPATPITATGINRTLIKTYAIASLVWRMLFYAGIVLTAATLFQGAGVVLSLGIAAIWICLPAARFVRYLIRGNAHEQPRRVRFVGILAAAVFFIGGTLCLPWPGGVVATGVVEYAPLEIVRAISPGFLRSVLVESGQLVAAGDRLVVIENPLAHAELKSLDLEIAKAELLERKYLSEQDYAQRNVQSMRIAALTTQRRELLQQIASLHLNAPVAGRIIGRDLTTRIDQYLPAGTSILAIGREESKQIVVTVAQQDADSFHNQIGTMPRVRIKGRSGTLPGARLTRLNPRATKRLFHGALAAPNGGPLPVTASASGIDPQWSDDRWELLEPHFQATVSLPTAAAAQLHAGELARVRLGATGESVGRRVWNAMAKWAARKLGQSETSAP